MNNTVGAGAWAVWWPAARQRATPYGPRVRTDNWFPLYVLNRDRFRES